MISLMPIALAATSLAIHHVNIVTPGSDRIAKDQSVVIEGNQIKWVGPTGKFKLGSTTHEMDATGKYVIPGLWDMHIHTMDAKTMGLFTANGVTGVRIMFGMPMHRDWRKQAADGSLLGPQIVLGSPIVDGPKPIWPGSIAVANAEQARAAVRKIKADGYDFVKVYSLLSKESIYAIADECKKQGIEFAGHVPDSIGILEADGLGQRTSEHLMGVVTECSVHAHEFHSQVDVANQQGRDASILVKKEITPKVKEGFDPKLEAKLIKGLQKGQMWQCPTLIVLKNISYMNNPDMLKDERMKYLPLFVTSGWDPTKDFRLKNRTPEGWINAQKAYLESLEFAKKLVKAKVKILAGTDCMNPFVYPGFSLHDELDMLVQVGMKPTDALAAATTSPAKFFGWTKQMGTVSAGKEADLVLLDANPLEDIKNTKRINAVVQNGVIFERAKLDQMLKEREYAVTKK